MRARQSSFFSAETFAVHNRLEHGGSRRKGKRKLARPIDTKRPMHVVLRSSRAQGEWSFLRRRHGDRVRRLIDATAKKCRVRIYEFANAGNHIHLLLKPASRKGFQAFLRTISGLIARLITGARRGRSIRGKFWDGLAFSRVVQWGRDFIGARGYLLRNRLEAIGFLDKTSRMLPLDAALKAASRKRNSRPGSIADPSVSN